jgi:hypothetical protein
VRTAGVPIRIFAEDRRPADALWFVECYLDYARGPLFAALDG